jgi:hypothetical protein
MRVGRIVERTSLRLTAERQEQEMSMRIPSRPHTRSYSPSGEITIAEWLSKEVV